jgi:dihydropyrimidine dehydrogenase (NADP+)
VPSPIPAAEVGISTVAAQAEPDLSVKVNGLEMPNPFVIGSGPPGTNYTVMKRAFDEGWGAVIAKTVQLVNFITPFFFLV